MKTISHCLAITAVLICSAIVVHAATWYFQGGAGSVWSDPANWNSSADGSGSSAVSFNAGDVYDSNGKGLLTPNVRDNDYYIFPGGTLRLNGSVLKTNQVGTTGASVGDQWRPYTIGKLVVIGSGSRIESPSTAAGASVYFSITDLELQSDLELRNARGSTSTFSVIINDVSGNGAFILDVPVYNPETNPSAARLALSIADQSLTNNFTVTAATKVRLDANLSSTGTLSLGTGSVIDLNGKSLSFSFITAGSSSLEVGTYTVGELSGTNLEGFFTGDGSIIVTGAIPEPAACALLLGGLTIGLAALLHHRRRA